jgi:hypothetical protein
MRLVVTALLLLAGCSLPAVQDGARPVPAVAGTGAGTVVGRTAVAFPDALAGFRRVGEITDYGRVAGDPGLGVSARYLPSNGERVVATVYVYDLGRPRLVDGGDSPEATEELRRAGAEIGAMVRLGRFRAAAPEAGMRLDRTPSLRCTNYRVVQADGAPTGDSACVSVQGGMFVKVRVTAWATPEPTIAGLFASGLLSAMLDARAAGGRPAPPRT